MIDALSASRRSLEAERSKALADVARTDEEIKTAEARLERLRSQQALQAGNRSSSPRVLPRCGGRLLMARAEGRRTIVDALDGLTAELRLANRLRLLSLPASVLEHDRARRRQRRSRGRVWPGRTCCALRCARRSESRRGPMLIEAEVTVTLAEVEVNDEYGVALNVRRRRTGLTPNQATQLGNALLEAAAESREKLAADRVTYAHAFDVAPSCRECVEGKHGACIGSTWVENRFDIDEVDCGCHRAGHQVHGSAA